MNNTALNIGRGARIASLALLVLGTIAPRYAGADDTNTYDVTFSTSNQHKWLPPEQAATAGETELFGASFDVGAEDITLPKLQLPVLDQLGDIPDVFDVVDKCFYFVDVDACADCAGSCLEDFFDTFGCNASCLDECIPCIFGNCDACNACISDCNADAFSGCQDSCEECDAYQICLADLMGAEITDVSLAAGYHMYFDYGPLTATENNNVSVSYPVQVDIQSPTADSFVPGDTVTINTSWSPVAGATMNTTAPSDPITLRNEMYFDPDIQFDLCGPLDGDCNAEDNDSLIGVEQLFDLMSFGSAENPLSADLFTITSAGESICDADPSAILCALGFGGDLGLPNVTTSTSSNGSACLASGEVTDRFVDIDLDIDSWIAYYLCPPCKAALPSPLTGFYFGFGPVSLGAFTIGVNVWDWDATFVFDQTESFSFCGNDVEIGLNFGTPVPYTIKDSSDVVQESGTSDNVTVLAGEHVDLTVPNQVLSVSPTFALDNTYSPSGDVKFKLGMDMSFLSLSLAIPSFTLLCNPFDTSQCLDFPYVDLGTLGPVIRIASEGDPSENPVINANFGNIAVADLGLFDSVSPFELQGFNAPTGASFSIDPEQPPMVAADTATITVDEGTLATNTGVYSDPEGDALTLTASFGTVTNNNDGTWSWSGDAVDGPADSQTVTITADDGVLTSSTMFDVVVNNVAPTIESLEFVSAVVALGEPVEAQAMFSDAGIDDVHTADFDWNASLAPGTQISAGVVSYDGTTGIVDYAYFYDEPGVYTVELTVTDNDADSDTIVHQYVVVYDPDGQFVTGGGKIDSPYGAYPADPSLTGVAQFGFVSHYDNGANEPTGDANFKFKVADLHFKSTSYDWLVVGGAQGKFKGVGTINDLGNYGFLIAFKDEALTPSTDVDLFRIKIWDEDNDDLVVYDNQMGDDEDAAASSAITHGQIKIH